ncbi:hypothetical protein Q9L58_010928, partial [Maublancomyces gigas]
MNGKSRSPLKDKPLRQPGQSVAEEREDLVENNVGQPLTLAAFFPNPVIYTGAALLCIAYAAIRIWRTIPKLRQLRLAKEGEQAVGQFLERLREQGFHVFHDVIGSGFNVDHVLVGPSGVFTVETKTWSKPLTGTARLSFDGETIRMGSLSPDRDPVIQAKAQAGWLKAILLESTGKTMDVRPVVVFPGWFVENAAGTFKDLW